MKSRRERRAQYGGAVAPKRLAGWKQCEWRKETASLLTPWESADGEARKRVGRKGDRCRNFLPPETVAERGVAICGKHLPFFEKDLLEKEATRLALRKKYDPGPLPLESDTDEEPTP